MDRILRLLDPKILSVLQHIWLYLVGTSWQTSGLWTSTSRNDLLVLHCMDVFGTVRCQLMPTKPLAPWVADLQALRPQKDLPLWTQFLRPEMSTTSMRTFALLCKQSSCHLCAAVVIAGNTCAPKTEGNNRKSNYGSTGLAVVSQHLLPSKWTCLVRLLQEIGHLVNIKKTS